VQEEEKQDIVIESENINSGSNNSNSESENIYSENEDDNSENEEFVTEDNSDSNSEDESDPDKELEVILRRSGSETRKVNDLLRNINVRICVCFLVSMGVFPMYMNMYVRVFFHGCRV